MGACGQGGEGDVLGGTAPGAGGEIACDDGVGADDGVGVGGIEDFNDVASTHGDAIEGADGDGWSGDVGDVVGAAGA